MSAHKKLTGLGKVKCVGTNACVSVEHGNLVCASIVRGSSDEAIWFLRQVCASFSTILDADGYSGLHIAAACRKNKVASYLIANGAKVNLQHEKSGNTALHLAVIFGNIDTAHLLLKFGADPNIVNSNGYSSLTCLAMQQPFKVFDYPNTVMCLQVYAWGANANYNLGLAKQYSGGIPECIDIDLKENDDIVEICPNKYHTLFRSRKGKVFACGHGRGGRLGMSVQTSVIIPVKLTFFKIKVVKMSAGVDHSVFLTENHQVWTCGKNSYKQLGFDPPPDYLTTPQSLKTWFSTHPEFAKAVVGVGAGAYHTVLYTSKLIVSFGLNGGQLGHLANAQSPFIIYPTVITSPRNLFMKFENSSADRIALFFVGDAALLFSSNNGNIYIVSNYELHCIIQFGKLYNKTIRKLCCIGGSLDTKSKLWNEKYLSHHQASPITLAILSTDNLACLFSLQYSGRSFNLSDPWQLNHILDFCLNPIDVHFVTASLQCCKLNLDKITFFKDKVKPFEDLEGSLEISLDVFTNSFIPSSSLFIQLPYLCRPYSIFCDHQGLNYFALQYTDRTFSKNVPIVTCKSSYKEDFLQLYEKLSDADQNCDVAINVDGRKFASHGYIISYHSNFLYNEILTKKKLSGIDKLIEIEIKQIEQDVFECILKSLYSQCPKPLIYSVNDNCASVEILNTSQAKHLSSDYTSDEENYLNTHRKTKKRKAKMKLSDFQQNVLNATKILGFQNFTYRGHYLVLDRNNIDSTRKKPTSSTFLRHKLSELWDIWFQCKDSDELLGAHRCIAVARCPYFDIFLSTRWAAFDHESLEGDIIQMPCSYGTFKAILDYLYTDGDFHLKNLNVEVLCEILVNSNLYLLPRLQEMCEVLISKRITLRNCLDLLQFCHTYNAENLLSFIHEFLALNIQYFLPSRSFKECDDECIKEFTEVYQQIVYKHDIKICPSQGVSDIDYDHRYHESNGHLDSENTSYPCAIDYKPFAIQKFWVDNYSEHPSSSELQQGPSEDLSDFNESNEGWVESLKSPRQNKIKKASSGRKRPRSTNTKIQTATRARTASQSSIISTSSNSENEDHHDDDQEQFTFDDLTERNDWKTDHEKEKWHVVGKKGIMSVEEKLEELTFAPAEVCLSSCKLSEDSKCGITTQALDVGDNSQTNQVVFSKNEAITKTTIPVSFPTLQEVMTMEVASKVGSKGKSPKMPKMTLSKKKKITKGEQDIEVSTGSSPSTPAWKGIGQVEESINLADIIKNENEVLKRELPANKLQDFPHGTKNKTARKLKLEQEILKPNLSESPDVKGWNIPEGKCNDITSPFDISSPSPSKIQDLDQSLSESFGESSSFQSIMEDEASKSNNLKRTLNKPLHLIQLEERAIEELFEFYGGAYNPDECVTVTRMKNTVATPLWKKS